MEKIVVSARPSSGYWWMGMKWGTQPTELEVIDQPVDEIVTDSESFEEKAKKFELKKKRIAAGKITVAEVELLRKDPHLAEAVIQDHSKALAAAVANISELETKLADAGKKISELEAQIADLTAPKKVAAK